MKAKVKTWLRNIENGNIANNTEKILHTIKEYTPHNDRYDQNNFKQGINTDALRNMTGIPHQSLTAILSVLHDEGLIKPIGEVEKDQSWYSIWAFIHDLEYRKRVQRLREQEKYVKWLKKADEYMDLMEYRTREYLMIEQQKYNVRD